MNRFLTLQGPPRAAVARIVNLLFLLFAYGFAAAAGFNGFVGKYGFHDMPDSFEATQRYAFTRMMDQSAERPFVYRQLLPLIARGVEDTMAPQRREALGHRIVAALHSNWSLEHTFGRSSAMQPRFALSYLIVYTLTFFSFFAALLFMRSVCLSLTGDPVAATLAPLAFAVVTPLLMSKNGYFYDFPEILFMSLGAWLALRDRWVTLAVVTAVATLNKETYFLFALALMPFMIHGKPAWRDGLKIAAVVAAGVSVNLAVKAYYVDSPGAPIEIHLRDNLQFYLNPLSYLRLAINYGVVTPNAFFVVNLALVAALVVRAWPMLPRPMRRHAVICAVINFPLFFVFCAPEELRNLSLLYLTLTVLIAFNLMRWIRATQDAPIARG